MPIILDGKRLADGIANDLAGRVASLSRPPTLAIVSVGERADSSAFIAAKERFGKRVGAAVRRTTLPAAVSQTDLEAAIAALAADRAVDGIILQLPIAVGLDAVAAINCIPPEKDIDGLSAANIRAHLEGKAPFVPATARGICNLLDGYSIPVAGRHAVVIGRSVLVGKSVALALLSRDATVTICHRKTADLAAVSRLADILVVAAGSPKLIGAAHVHSGAVVIDVGISPVGEPDPATGRRKLSGDVDFDAVLPVAGALSPVPGGVGPMTVSALFQNLIEAAERGR